VEKSSLQQIAEIFARHGVEFVVIGGQAEALMGSARVTYDVDFCYRRTPENLQRVADALKEIKPTLRGAPSDLPFTLDTRALAQGNNFTLSTSLGDLDLLGWVEPLGDYDAIIKHAETFPVDELQIKTIGLDDLIRVKEHIRRSKDQESLLQLKAIRRLRDEKPSQ
jgi:predicted nucleotidyltransferase